MRNLFSLRAVRILFAMIGVLVIVGSVWYLQSSRVSNLRQASTYDCNGHALTASAIATQRQISAVMYDELLAHFKITPSELCRISDSTLQKLKMSLILRGVNARTKASPVNGMNSKRGLRVANVRAKLNVKAQAKTVKGKP